MVCCHVGRPRMTAPAGEAPAVVDDDMARDVFTLLDLVVVVMVRPLRRELDTETALRAAGENAEEVLDAAAANVVKASAAAVVRR